MKLYLLTLTLLFTLPTTQINASLSKEVKISISEEAESVLQKSFSKDRTFKKHARKVFVEKITKSNDQEKIMKAIALYRTGIQTADDLSHLFDLLAQHVLNNTLDDLTSNLDTVIEAYRDDQDISRQGSFKPDRLKGDTLLDTIVLLSTIQQTGFLNEATNAIVKFLTFPEFGTYLNFSRLYLIKYFLTPLSKKSTWDNDLTDAVLENLSIFKKKIGHISAMNIGVLYGTMKHLIEES